MNTIPLFLVTFLLVEKLFCKKVSTPRKGIDLIDIKSQLSNSPPTKSDKKSEDKKVATKEGKEDALVAEGSKKDPKDVKKETSGKQISVKTIKVVSLPPKGKKTQCEKSKCLQSNKCATSKNSCCECEAPKDHSLDIVDPIDLEQKSDAKTDKKEDPLKTKPVVRPDNSEPSETPSLKSGLFSSLSSPNPDIKSSPLSNFAESNFIAVSNEHSSKVLSQLKRDN